MPADPLALAQVSDSGEECPACSRIVFPHAAVSDEQFTTARFHCEACTRSWSDGWLRDFQDGNR